MTNEEEVTISLLSRENLNLRAELNAVKADLEREYEGSQKLRDEHGAFEPETMAMFIERLDIERKTYLEAIRSFVLTHTSMLRGSDEGDRLIKLAGLLCVLEPESSDMEEDFTHDSVRTVVAERRAPTYVKSLEELKICPVCQAVHVRGGVFCKRCGPW